MQYRHYIGLIKYKHCRLTSAELWTKFSILRKSKQNKKCIWRMKQEYEKFARIYATFEENVVAKHILQACLWWWPPPYIFHLQRSQLNVNTLTRKSALFYNVWNEKLYASNSQWESWELNAHTNDSTLLTLHRIVTCSWILKPNVRRDSCQSVNRLILNLSIYIGEPWIIQKLIFAAPLVWLISYYHQLLEAWRMKTYAERCSFLFISMWLQETKRELSHSILIPFFFLPISFVAVVIRIWFITISKMVWLLQIISICRLTIMLGQSCFNA